MLDELTFRMLPVFHVKIFLGLLALKVLIQNYLDLRQKKHIRKHREKVPAKFTSFITIEEHLKAADYSLARMNFGKISRSFGLIMLLFWTLAGGIDYVSTWAGSLAPANSPLVEGLMLFGIYGTISYFLGLPFELYSTFVLEENFGFNKTTRKIFITDQIKQLLLSLIIGFPILALILYFMQQVENWWLYTFIALSSFQILMMFIYPIFIAPLFNKFTPLADGEQKAEATQLLEEVKFSAKELLVMDASRRNAHGNAYFTGFGKARRIVFYDTLLEDLSPKEMRAVLAHEIGHFKKRHIYKGIAVSLTLSLVGLYVLWFLSDLPVFYQMHGVKNMGNAQALLLFSLVGGIYTFFLTPIGSFFSRKHEYEADAFACQHAQKNDLATALIKLYKNNAAFLCIDPFYASFYYSHPTANERVEHIEKQPLKELEPVPS